MSSSKTSPSHSGGSGSTHPSASNSPRNATQWFATEIQQMMHGLGDSRRPLFESALLIERLVHQQMTSLLFQASAIAFSRNARFIGIEDFLFLIRKDKLKLRRLLRYMMLKDKTAALKTVGQEEEDAESGESKPVQPLNKRTKVCHDFLASIDQTGELLSQFEDESLDEVKHERLLRAELRSRTMCPAQYIEFCEARQVTFGRRYKSPRFKDWLLTGIQLDIKPNVMALEVLSYLAYETVAQVVDLSLLVKRDQKMCADDPLAGKSPSVCLNYHASALVPCLESPPSTPTSGSHLTNPFSQPHQTYDTSSGSKKSSKKKRKSGLSQALEAAASSTIMPADIREALRRYSQCFGPFTGLNMCKDFLVNPKSKVK